MGLTSPPSTAEILVATAGAGLAIYLIYVISLAIVGPQGALWMVTSMGAAAVLLFAVPHGPLSQPWPLFGGNGISAIIGVACATWLPDPAVAAAVAVGLAVGTMYFLRCIHPPGGATALGAVLGGSAIVELGFAYVLAPVLLNVLIIFLVALAVNYPFAWRRYPLGLAPAAEVPSKSSRLSEEDLAYALRETKVVVDVSPEELRYLANLALDHADDEKKLNELQLEGVMVQPDGQCSDSVCPVAFYVKETDTTTDKPR